MFSLKRKPTHCCTALSNVSTASGWFSCCCVCPEKSSAPRPSSSSMAGGTQAGSFTVRCVPLHAGRTQYVVSCSCSITFVLYGDVHSFSIYRCAHVLCSSQVCLTDRSALKGSTAISCTCFEIPGKNSGRPTETCTCPQTAV